MKKDKRIRQGDQVIIRKPETFVRCGYPMDVETEAKRIEEEQRDAILAIFHDEGVGKYLKNSIDLFSLRNEQDARSFRKVCREIAYAKCKAEGFGGSERTIYTKSQPELQDMKARVLEVKMCKTGKYLPASSHYVYDYACTEYEPAELYDQKTHKLLRIHCQCDKKVFRPPSDLWIEAVNVEKCL